MSQPSPAPTAPQSTPEPTARRGGHWPVLIVSLLLLNVAVCAVTVTLSLRNPAAIEDDYYARGLNWDDQRTSETASTPATTPTHNANTDTRND